MNNVEKREWRTLQIAASEIMRYNQNAQVEISSNRYYDLLVIQDGNGVRYGVEIVRSEFSRTKSYPHYIELLQQHSGEINIPIVLMSVNEAAEDVKIGILLTWFHQHAHITRDMLMRKSSQESWNDILNMISVSGPVEGPIKYLQSDKFYIKKSIPLIAEGANRRQFDAELVYLRKFTPDYKMHTRERNTQEEVMDYLLNGYDADEYPSDLLDDAIYRSVSERLDVPPAMNQLILMNTQLRDLQIYRGYHRGQAHITISPRFDGPAVIANRMLGRFSTFVFDVDLYAYTAEDLNYFNDWDFSCQDNLDDWVTNLIGYRAAMQQYKKLSEVIG